MAGFGKNIGGSAANSFASGDVYNRWRGTYAPGGVVGTRMGIGAAQNFGGPIGSLAGWLANKIYSRNNPDAQRFDNQLQTDNIIGPQREAFNEQLMRDAMGRQWQPPTQGPVQDAHMSLASLIPKMGGWTTQPGYGSAGNVNPNTFINRANFPVGPLPTNVGDAAVSMPQVQNPGAFRDANGNMNNGSGPVSTQQGGWASQAGGGASQGGGHGQGWTGISGDAARSMFGGMAQGSSNAIRDTEYAQFMKFNRT